MSHMGNTEKARLDCAANRCGSLDVGTGEAKIRIGILYQSSRQESFNADTELGFRGVGIMTGFWLELKKWESPAIRSMDVIARFG